MLRSVEMKPQVSIPVAASLVWAAIGCVALVLPMLVGARQVSATISMIEIALCAPMAVWLGWLTAHALADRRWVMLSRSVWQLKDPAWYWAFIIATIAMAGTFLAGFVRGVVSVTAFL